VPIVRSPPIPSSRHAEKRPGGLVSPSRCLRTRCGTHLLDDGVSLVVIQALPGHSNLKTTARYLHVSDAAVGSTKSPLEMLGSLDLVRAAKDIPPKRFGLNFPPLPD
jgi:integrase